MHTINIRGILRYDDWRIWKTLMLHNSIMINIMIPCFQKLFKDICILWCQAVSTVQEMENPFSDTHGICLKKRYWYSRHNQQLFKKITHLNFRISEFQGSSSFVKPAKILNFLYVKLMRRLLSELFHYDKVGSLIWYTYWRKILHKHLRQLM